MQWLPEVARVVMEARSVQGRICLLITLEEKLMVLSYARYCRKGVHAEGRVQKAHIPHVFK